MIGRQTPVILGLESELKARGEELTRALGHPVSGIDVFLESARLGNEIEHERTGVRKDGTHFNVSLVLTTIRDPNDQIIGIMGIVRDITESKRIEAALAPVRHASVAS